MRSTASASRPSHTGARPSEHTPAALEPVLIGRLRAAARRDWFGVLGIHWSAYPAVIARAHRREVARLEAARQLPEMVERFRSDLDLLGRAIGEAFQALQHPERRRVERVARVNRMQRESAVTLYMNQGEMSIMRGNEEEARDAFLRVLELSPDHAGARMQLAVRSA